MFCQIKTIKELNEWLNSTEEIKLYGAGFYLNVVLKELGQLDRSYLKKVSCILVSDTAENPPSVQGIPVVDYQKAKLASGSWVLMALGHRFTNEVRRLLKPTGVCLAELDFQMFQERAYRETKERLLPFINRFPSESEALIWGETGNNPSLKPIDSKITVWTLWWQGEESAPELVKACFRSQKKYLPAGSKHIIITEENHKDYIELPPSVMEKVKRGTITLTTLSDIIRAALLYRYGGFWMDATLFVLKPFEKGILDYPLYTRNIPETQYCTEAMWAGWFFYARAGHKLFRFLWKGFCYYFSVYDRITDYFMVDYVIAIACNLFPEIERQLQSVPYNNEKAQELGRHLTEHFDREKYERYTNGAWIQKLTYKLDWIETEGKKDTIYEWITRQ